MPSVKWIKSGDESTGAVKAYAVDAATGKLTPGAQPAEPGGAGPCHISVVTPPRQMPPRCELRRRQYRRAASIHADGSLGEATDTIQHFGSSVNTNRQGAPHAHFIIPSPDNRFVLNCDLGLDKIFIYHLDADAGKLSSGRSAVRDCDTRLRPAPSGFSADGKFCLCHQWNWLAPSRCSATMPSAR